MEAFFGMLGDIWASQTHRASNWDTHLNLPHNTSLVHLTTTIYVRCSGRIINGMRSGRTAPYYSAFSSPTAAPTHPEWPSQEEPGSGSFASAPMSDVSAPVCTNGAWPPLRPLSVAQKNKPSIMLSSNIQPINLPMDCMDWRLWTMRQSNGCSTPAPRSCVTKQCFKQLAQNTKKIFVWQYKNIAVTCSGFCQLHSEFCYCLQNISVFRAQICRFFNFLVRAVINGILIFWNCLSQIRQVVNQHFLSNPSVWFYGNQHYQVAKDFVECIKKNLDDALEVCSLPWIKQTKLVWISVLLYTEAGFN